MNITLNGNKIETSARTLSELIAERDIHTAGLAVAVNSKIIRRNDWETAPVENEAVITLIRATQGG